jgi:hypothetical protein
VTLDDRQLQALAGEHGCDVQALRDLLIALCEQVGADGFYVFWTTGTALRPAGARRRRTLLAFPTADAALAFAQRNQLGGADRARVRRLSMLQIVQATLREQAITAILFVEGRADEPPAGRLPHGVRVARADLLRSLCIST